MNILIIGANGGIGKSTVVCALEAGHRVTALVRNPANLTISHPNLEIVKGDVMQPETFEKYLQNKDAIISALGVKKLKPTTLYSEGNRNLLGAMNRVGINRVFFISAAAIEVSPLQSAFVRLLTKHVVQRILRNPYADQRVMEALVRESGTNWTIMRPPRLSNKPATRRYRVAINSFLKNCLSISRADVAHFMINNVDNAMTYKTIIEIAE